MSKEYRVSQKRTWIVTGVVVGVLGAAVALHRWSAEPDAHSAAQPAAAKPAARKSGSRASTDPASVRAGFFPLGSEQSFEIQEKSQVTATTGQTIADVSLRGTLTLTGLQTDPFVRVRGKFDGTLSTGTMPGANPAVDAELTTAAQLPFVLDFAPDGAFQRGSGSNTLPQLVARLWTSLGESLQLRRLDDAPQWELQETDGSGTYVAAYEQTTPTQTTKHKLRYESLVNATSFSSYEVLRSDIRFEADLQGMLAALSFEESTRANMRPGAPLPSFASSTALSLMRVRSGVQADLAALLQEAEQATALDQTQRQQDERARNLARVGGLSTDEAMDRLKLFNKEKLTPEEREHGGRAYVALTAMLREDPRVFERVREHLRKQGPLAVTLLGALRDASTPESQELLARLSTAGSPLDAEMRLEAARCLSRVTTPSIETARALTQLRADPEVGHQATLGLGSVLYRARGQDPILANEVRATLREQLSNADDPGEQANVLMAMGNAGDPKLLDSVRPFMASASEVVRASAAQAVRRIPGDAPEPLLAQACTDPSSEVRYAAVDAIRERDASTALAPALANIALHESENQVRARALNVLVDWLPTIPSLATTLEQIAQSDTSADMRNVARIALEKSRT